MRSLFIVVILLSFSSVSGAFATGLRLLPIYNHQSDNLSLDDVATLQLAEYHWQSGLVVARISEEEFRESDDSGEPETDSSLTTVDEGEEERAVDFRKIANGLWEGRPSEGYLYWYNGAEDLKGNTYHTRPWRYRKYDTLSEQTKYMTLMHVAAAGILYLMPESVTKWDKSSMSFSSVTDKWVKNVTSAPVWDKDDWVLNYVGHPYQGAIYYVVARHSGFDWKGAFLYSTFCSTFIWEYGFEAFAETPSIQDLIITPVTGAILGEMLLQGEERIQKNGGTLLGSKILGQVGLVLIDPAGYTFNSLQRWSDWPSRIRAHTEFFYEPLSVYNAGFPLNQLSNPDGRYGMRLVFTYN